jgi:serine/threonine protein kinase/LysM repeat protein
MIGQNLGGYEILELIGSGGMATVYKAYDPTLDRLVAVKTLPPQYTYNEMFRTRFEREARAITLLEHSHILPVFRHGEDQGVAYLAMRYVEAGTLKQWMSKRQVPLRQAYHIIEQIGGALDYAHHNGILHRDIKPSNVLIDRSDNTYLTDFGLAKILEDSSGGLTGTEFLGTPRYMSPEQCSDARVITAASDQYSLGVILYQMVTGQTPYNVDTPMAIVNKHLVQAPFMRPCQLRPELPSRAELVILRALSHDPLERFESCGQMADAFEDAIGDSGVATNPNMATPMIANSVNAGHTLLSDTDTVSPVAYAISAPWDNPQPVPSPARARKGNWWVLAVLGIVAAAIGIGLLVLNGGGDDGNPQAAARPTATRFVTPFPTQLPTLVVIPTRTVIATVIRNTRVEAATVTPLAIATRSGCEEYAVVAGDTFFGIAEMFGVSGSELAALNDLSDNPLLQIGEILLIPSDTCQESVVASLAPTVNLTAIHQTATALASPIKISVRNPGVFDAEGVGITNLNSTRDVSGWQLVDEDGHIYEFPDMILFSSGSVTVYTRSGQNTPVALYWNEGEALWEAGEVATVLDADGGVVATVVVSDE